MKCLHIAVICELHHRSPDPKVGLWHLHFRIKGDLRCRIIAELSSLKKKHEFSCQNSAWMLRTCMTSKAMQLREFSSFVGFVHKYFSVTFTSSSDCIHFTVRYKTEFHLQMFESEILPSFDGKALNVITVVCYSINLFLAL